MRTAYWFTPLLALLAISHAHQVWRTSERLHALETADAWSAESVRLELKREGRSAGQAELNAKELGHLNQRLSVLDHWRVDFDSFTAATRSSQAILREEMRQALAASRSISSPSPHEHEVEEHLAATLSKCEQRLDSSDGALADLRMRFESNRLSLVALHEAAAQTTPHANGHRWNNLLGPAVQLSGGGTIGSAVLLPGELTAQGWRTRVLTAWHVVRDIRLGLGKNAPIPVMVYSEDGSVRKEEARLLCRNTTMDIALLELTSTNTKLPEVRLASRETLNAIEVFEPIYAVGCPLGNDPIPTYGQLSDSHHDVDGTNHWMISAPTYIGNSGGGIFHAETDELIGIFSKIYTHGTLRPTVIPHMGLAVPLAEIYDWLEHEGYASLTPTQAIPLVAAASAR
jgi:S1-C subfamily serine protease